MPLDSPRFCRRFIEHWRPDLALFTESEIWPNLIVEASDKKVPLVLVNARMSHKSGKRWARMPSLSKPVFSRFDLVLTQNYRFAKRLTALGARKAVITGNLKYDAPPPPVDAGAAEELRRDFEDRPVFLAASTHPGEDEAVARAAEILQSTMPSLLTVIVPRHPERGEAIASLLEARNLTVARRSGGRAGHCAKRRSTSPTPSANLGCSTSSRRCRSSAARSSSMAGRTQSKPSSSALAS